MRKATRQRDEAEEGGGREIEDREPAAGRAWEERREPAERARSRRVRQKMPARRSIGLRGQ